MYYGSIKSLTQINISFYNISEMGVDDNPRNIAAKQKQKIQSAKQKGQEGEKSSSSAAGSSEQIGGRTLRLRQRTSAADTGEAGTKTALSDAANSE